MLENKIQTRKNEREAGQRNIIYVNIDNVRPNPYQPRKQFNKSSLEELCESIKQYGVLQPINVRRLSNNTYELVAGERRLRASRMAGLTEIPAILNDVDDNNSAVIALIENLQREDLNYMEEAEGYNNLISDHGFTQEELAQKKVKASLL
jgi:ParB family chromosome partitioning protein